MTPQIVCQDYGKHNALMDETIRRLNAEGVYKDLSTVIIIPAFGSVPTKCVASWWNIITPPNGKIFRLWALGMEVGEAYSQTIENVLAHPELSKFKYLCTIEHDNTVEPDGLIKLLRHIEQRPELACISALYYTKGEGGQPQIWGDPRAADQPNFRPQPPRPGEVVECVGTGMGFAVWRMEMFKDKRIARPLFKTKCSAEEGVGTQDLAFWTEARKYGYRCAVACDVFSGHYDLEGKFGPPDTTW